MDKDLEQIKILNLQQIANWQLETGDENSEGSIVTLPSLQRGFVWKAMQIEKVWDSLLRGFPIGSFIAAETTDDKLELFDGQQRVTSIALGFRNPWKDDKKLKLGNVSNAPVLWFDFNPNVKYPDSKFGIRLVTSSHPWGYNNGTRFSVGERKDALKKLSDITGDNPYTEINLKEATPLKAGILAPFYLLIEEAKQEITSNEWVNRVLDKWQVSEKNIPQLEEREKLKEFNEDEKLVNLRDKAYDAFLNLKKRRIAMNIFPKEILKDSDSDKHATDPVLFVRLNSSGTRLEGEELIYSILKAEITGLKEFVEGLENQIIQSSRITVTLVRLLLGSDENKNFPAELSVKKVQNALSDSKNNLKSKLEQFINENNNKILFNIAFSFFHNTDNNFSIPKVLVRSLIKENPDLFLLLLMWTNQNINDFKNEENIKQYSRQIIGCFTTANWYFKGIDNLNYAKELWEHISKENRWNGDIWTSNILQQPFKDKNKLPLILDVDLIKKIKISLEKIINIEISNGFKNQNTKSIFKEILLKEYDDNEKLNKSINQRYPFEKLNESESDFNIDKFTEILWDKFLHKLYHHDSRYQRLLFAQRYYITTKFKAFDQVDVLDDTNTPWDWDHIYPSSFVYYRKNISDDIINIIKFCTYSIGNLRAIELSENRADGNRIKPSEKYMTVGSINSFESPETSEFFRKIDTQINDQTNKFELLGAYFLAVTFRAFDMYTDWYNTLEIGKIFPSEME